MTFGTTHMHVVEIFLPLRFPTGDPVPAGQFRLVQSELTEQFGGVTSYSRSPAEGAWRRGEEVERDLVLVFEVMVDKLENDWWSAFRSRMEAIFRQQTVLIRSHKVFRL